MGILDILSSAPTKNPYAGTLSDEAWSYYEKMQSRQRVGQVMRTLGNTLSNAAWGRPPTGGGGGGGGGSQDALMQMMQMQALLEKRQDRDAKRQRQQTKDDANAAILAKIRGLSGPVGPEMRVPGPAGAAPVTAQALPPRQPMSGLRSDPEFIASLMAANPKIATSLMFPKTKERRIVKGRDDFSYYADTGERVLPGVKKKSLVPFSALGKLASDVKAGFVSPEDAKARRQKLAYASDRRTTLQKDVPYLAKLLGISEKEAARLKTQSRRMSPEQFRQSVAIRHMSGGMNSAAEAIEEADKLMKVFYPETAGAAPPAPRSSAEVSGGPPFAMAVAKGSAAVPRYPGMPRPSAAQAAALVGQTVTIGGKPYEVVKENPDGTVTIMDLATGENFIAR